jgi:hypothetical protein
MKGERSGSKELGLTCKTLVLMVAEMTTPLPSIVWVTGLVFNPKIVWQPKLGTGPKEVAKRLARKVKRLFATAGAGDMPPWKRAWLAAMKRPDAAYCWQ